MQYPKGTTKEQWDRYNEEFDRHKEFVSDYRHFLNKIVNHLEWKANGQSWTTKEIKEVMESEIHRVEFMDAPNKPGYYRANND